MRTTRWRRSTTSRRSSTKPRKMSAKAIELIGAPAAARDPTARLQPGRHLLELRARPRKPSAQFEKAIELDPKMADAHYWLGMAHVNQGKMPDAKAVASGVPEAGADRPERRDRQEHSRRRSSKWACRRPARPTIAAATSRPCAAASRRRRTRRPRPADAVTLVAVSKTFGADLVRAAAAPASAHFGENRVQEGLDKIDALADLGLDWHLIGHLQSNKARKAAAAFAWIQSIDSLDLLQKVDAAARGAGTRPRDPRSRSISRTRPPSTAPTRTPCAIWCARRSTRAPSTCAA